MDERFRLELGQRLTAIETSQKIYHDEMKSIIESLHKQIETNKVSLTHDVSSVKMTLSELGYTLYGGPKADNVGLLEQFRKMAWKMGYVFTAIMALVGFGGKILTPLIVKAIEEWRFASPAHRYMAEQKRPKITRKVYKVYQTPPPPAE